MLTAAALLASLAFSQQPAASPDQAALLTPIEAAQGFRLLSGPDATHQWRGFKAKGFPDKGWTFADGILNHAAGGGGGDIITDAQFADFELDLEYRTGKGANSGIIYHSSEAKDTCWMTGPEFQVLDDAATKESLDAKHSAGALYDLIAAPADKVFKPAGEWNHARIYFRNGVVQHWLNAKKTAEFRMFDDSGKPNQQWESMIAASKFKAWPGFGLETRGHIALQDHGDEVAYRNIKVRDLSAPMPGEIRLSGDDRSAWTPIVPDAAKNSIQPADVWSVDGDVLVCKGTPAGYLRTSEKYTNFILRLEWRFNPETKKAGNSGVLFRMTGEDKVWPRSLEAQLMSGSAGDFFGIDGFKYEGDAARMKGRHTPRTHSAERAVGEWNEYEIIVNKGEVTLIINGEQVNHATGAEEIAGYIALQSEGVEIQFRNIRLSPL